MNCELMALSKTLFSAKRTRNNQIQITVDKDATIEEVNFGISHIADLTIIQWAKLNNMSIKDATVAYLTMLDSYEMDKHKENYDKEPGGNK